MPNNINTQPAHEDTEYEIRIAGNLAPGWSEWFNGFALSHTTSGETVLRGRVIDQSALYGLLARIRDLDLILVEVSRQKEE